MADYRPDWVSLIRTLAPQYGVDPRAALAVASREGLSGGVGDSGHAFGPFQLNDAGGVITNRPGDHRAFAESRAGIQWALQQIGKVAAGLHGQQAINAIVSRFERPANIPGEIQGALSALGQFSGGGLGGPQLAPPRPTPGLLPQAQPPALAGAGTRALLAHALLSAASSGNYMPFFQQLRASRQAMPPPMPQQPGIPQAQAAQPAAFPTVGIPAGRGGYVNPFPQGARQNRTDAGLDIQGRIGTYVGALGSGTVTFAGPTNPGGYGQMVVYKLDHPPDAAHQYIFVGHAAPGVHVGQRVTPGQPVSQLVQRSGGDASNLAGWAEMGWAAGPGPTPLSATRGHYHANTPEGHHFVQWLRSLGFVAADYGADTQGQNYPLPGR